MDRYCMISHHLPRHIFHPIRHALSPLAPFVMLKRKITMAFSVSHISNGCSHLNESRRLPRRLYICICTESARRSFMHVSNIFTHIIPNAPYTFACSSLSFGCTHIHAEYYRIARVCVWCSCRRFLLKNLSMLMLHVCVK